MLIKNSLDFLNVSLVANEGVSNELDLLWDGVEDVTTVFLCERGEVDADAWYVDALTATELTCVLAGGIELIPLFLLYDEG